jgi:hypothetical protein
LVAQASAVAPAMRPKVLWAALPSSKYALARAIVRAGARAALMLAISARPR